ncbi:MAG: hypothetical protein AAFO94_18755, partial [Bacteroidota bacterium]
KMLGKLKYDNPASFSSLFKLYHLNPSKELEAEINHHFFALSENLLFEHPNEASFDAYFRLFAKALDGYPVEDDIQLMYFMQKAKAASIAFNYEAAQKYINQAYQINPHDLRIQRILTEIVLEECQFETNEDKMGRYLQRYPFLKNHPQLNAIATDRFDDHPALSSRSAYPFYGVYFWPTATQQRRGFLPQLKGRLKLDPNYEIFRKALKNIFSSKEELLLTQH